jgi:putative spermidine/putrescine transport system permease protein
VKALSWVASWLQVAPVALILVLFFGLPMLVVVAVSFFDYGQGRLYPTFIFDNYLEIFASSLTAMQASALVKCNGVFM